MNFVFKSTHLPLFENWKNRKRGKKGGRHITYRQNLKKNAFKRTLQKIILDQQKGVCCYCGVKIAEPFFENSHIEHFDSDKSKDLDFANLFVSCGLSEKDYTPATCGFKKDNAQLDGGLIPSLSVGFTEVRFGGNGEIFHQTARAESAIVNLGLDETSLAFERGKVIQALESQILADGDEKELANELIKNVLAMYDAGDVDGFSHVVVNYLVNEFMI